MSRVIPTPGNVSASYWSYMAGKMAAWFEQMSKSRQVSMDAVPVVVYQDATRFWGFVRDAMTIPGSQWTLQGLNLYSFVARLLRGSRHISTKRELDGTMRKYATFIRRLPKRRYLTEAEASTAADIASFFRRVEREGEAEARGRRGCIV